MASNSFGDILRITTFGESHGPGLGVVIDGCPAGVPLQEADFLPELARRRPGQSQVTTQRQEADQPELLSGVFEGKTLGTPIAILVRNTDARSGDYSPAPEADRPGHADQAWREKFGHRDHRGGGRSSGRETVARVLGGVVARKLLPGDCLVRGHTLAVGPIRAKRFLPETIEANPMRCADPEAALAMQAYVLDLKAAGDSSGALLEIRVTGVPAGLGDPVFHKLKADLAHAILSIGAVTGCSYGAGFDTATMRGSEYLADPAHFGGMLGGISNGEELRLLVSIKPTTSIGDVAKLGRHDPCIAPRVVPVVEAMVALVL
ncbi:MAG TPA: chorismate synthase, partial [Planctomycetota bacterium]|nr:chorismate synthase [Planctomycetota bacterium]